MLPPERGEVQSKGGGEMVQQLKELTAVPEEPGSFLVPAW